jgi:hypothetical protein
MKTEELIEGLVRDVQPVRRLWNPWLRATLWVAATFAYLIGMAAIASPPGRLITGFEDLRFTFEQLAAVALGLTAGAAALTIVVPGRGVRILVAPIAASALWLAIVVAGGVQDAMRYGATGIPIQTDWPCVAAIVAGSALPAIALALMLRRGAPLAPGLTLALAVLSAAALANVSACLVRPHDTSVTVLLWHGTTLVLLCAGAAWFGSRVLRWTLPALQGSGSGVSDMDAPDGVR